LHWLSKSLKSTKRRKKLKNFLLWSLT